MNPGLGVTTGHYYLITISFSGLLHHILHQPRTHALSSILFFHEYILNKAKRTLMKIIVQNIQISSAHFFVVVMDRKLFAPTYNLLRRKIKGNNIKNTK